MSMNDLAKLESEDGLYKVRMFHGSGFVAKGSDYARPGELKKWDDDSGEWKLMDEWDATGGRAGDKHPDYQINEAKRRLRNFFDVEDVEVVEKTDFYDKKVESIEDSRK